MMALDTAKLGKLLALASSDNDHEALSALRMAKNVLTGAGLDFKHVAERLATPKASTYDFDAEPMPTDRGQPTGRRRMPRLWVRWSAMGA